MATVFQEYNIEEQRSVVRFRGPRDTIQKDVHKEIFAISCGKCLSRKPVNNCVETFSQGCLRAADDGRPVRPVEIATEAAVQRVEELVRAEENNDRQCGNCTRVFP
jgi:hypothetical protein